MIKGPPPLPAWAVQLVMLVIVMITLIGDAECKDDINFATYPDFGCRKDMTRNRRYQTEMTLCDMEEKDAPVDDMTPDEFTEPMRRYNKKWCHKACLLDPLGVIFTNDPKYEQSDFDKLRGEFKDMPIQHVFTEKKMLYREFGRIMGGYDCYVTELIKMMNNKTITDYCNRLGKVIDDLLACNSSMVADSAKWKGNCVEWKATFQCIEKVFKGSQICDMLDDSNSDKLGNIYQAVMMYSVYDNPNIDQKLLQWHRRMSLGDAHSA